MFRKIRWSFIVVISVLVIGAGWVSLGWRMGPLMGREGAAPEFLPLR